MWEFKVIHRGERVREREWERKRIKRPFFQPTSMYTWNTPIFFYGFYAGWIRNFYRIFLPFAFRYIPLASRTCFVLQNRSLLLHFWVSVKFSLSLTIHIRMHTYTFTWAEHMLIAHTSSAMQWNQYKPSAFESEMFRFKRGRMPTKKEHKRESNEWVL